MSLLKPSESIMVAAAVMAVVGGIYVNAAPSVADIRVGSAQDPDVESTRKLAAWTSAAVVAGISLISKDSNIFVTGGAMVIGLDWWLRHANEVDPVLKRAVPITVASDGSAGMDAYAGD